MNTLILTIGLPKSGKSTWAKKQNFPIVNKDAIRLALHGQRFLKEAETFVDTLSTYMVKSLFLAGHKTVIVDECHNTEKRRVRWKDTNWIVKFQIFSASKDECIRRAEAENDSVIIPVIERMAEESDYDAC